MRLLHGSVHTSRTVPSVSGLGRMHLKNDVHCVHSTNGRLTNEALYGLSQFVDDLQIYTSYCPHILGDLECVVDRAACLVRCPHIPGDLECVVDRTACLVHCLTYQVTWSVLLTGQSVWYIVSHTR